KNPFFDDLKYDVTLSSANVPLLVRWHLPGEKTIHETYVVPRCEAGDLYPVIGVLPITDVKLPPASLRKSLRFPVVRESAAARATPGFDFGDVIVAASDPDKPSKLMPLTSQDDSGAQSYDLFRRMKLLAGKPMVFEVRRQQKDKPPITLALTVPPSYHYVLP